MGCDLSFPSAVVGRGILPECQENWVPQAWFLRPAHESNSHYKLGSRPECFFIGLRRHVKGTFRGLSSSQIASDVPERFAAKAATHVADKAQLLPVIQT